MAPAHDLVDVAREIAQADAVITHVTTDKLRLIAEQIQGLQAQARAVLARAERDARIHRAECRFQKRPGKTYHVYRRPDGRLYLSMLSPADWGGTTPDVYDGAYRLEADQSWSSVEEIGQRALLLERG